MLSHQVDLNRIQLFLEIVRLGSITKTAKLLNLQKSKVSRDLSILEQELGVQLIFRTTRKFNLTIEGQKFYEKASESLQSLNTAISELSSQSKSIAGHISLTSPEDLGELLVIPILQEFSQLYPDVTYKLDFSTEVKDLVTNKVDMAVRPGKLPDSTMKMKKIGRIEFGLFCSKDLFEKLSEIKNPKQLSTLPTIVFQRDGKQPSWEFIWRNKRQNISLAPVVQVNSYIAASNLVKAGMGIALLPKFIVNSSGGSSGLVQILKQCKTESSDLQIVFPQRNEDLARVRVLSDFISKKIKATL